MNTPYNIALCGCGHIAQKHMDAIVNNPNLKLTALVDPQPTVREKYSTLLNVPTYPDLEGLAQHKLDLVTLCTPSGLHAQQTLWAANQGWHVISEKPLATSLEDGQAMLQVCQKNQVNLFLVHQLRYSPIMQAIKQAIEAEQFGNIYLVSSEIFWNRPQSYYDQVSWRGSKSMDGGAYLNQACHFIDLMCWLFGDVVKVQAMMRTLARNIETEDSGIINLEFATGALGSIAVTMLTAHKNLRGSLSIIGEKGSVVIDGPCLDNIAVWDFAGGQHAAPKCSSLPTGHHQFYNHVIASLRGENNTCITGHEGFKTLQVIMSAHQSSQEGKEIHL